MCNIIYFLKNNFEISGPHVGSGNGTESQRAALEGPQDSGRKGHRAWIGPKVKDPHENLMFHLVW